MRQKAERGSGYSVSVEGRGNLVGGREGEFGRGRGQLYFTEKSRIRPNILHGFWKRAALPAQSVQLLSAIEMS